jgi:putative addiction module killer protein
LEKKINWSGLDGTCNILHNEEHTLIEIKIRKLEVYETNGKKPFDVWLSGLRDKLGRARILTRLDRASEGNFGRYRPIGEIIELKENYGPGYRIYFALKDDAIILLLVGGDKSTQEKDIRIAKNYYNEFKNRKPQDA